MLLKLKEHHYNQLLMLQGEAPATVEQLLTNINEQLTMANHLEKSSSNILLERMHYLQMRAYS